MKRIALALIVSVCLAQTGCRHGQIDLNSPVVSMWDGGVHLIGKKPFVMFAAWPDGMVVRGTGEREKVGFVRPSEIADLVKAIKNDGFLKRLNATASPLRVRHIPMAPEWMIDTVCGTSYIV